MTVTHPMIPNPNSMPDTDAKARLARLDTYLSQDPNNELLRAEAFDLAIATSDVASAQRYLGGRLQDSTPWTLREAALMIATARYGEAAQRMKKCMTDDTLDASQRLSATLLWLRATHLAGDIDAAWHWLSSHLDGVRASPEIAAIGSLIAVDADQLSVAENLSDLALATYPGSREALVAKGTVLLARQDALGARDHARRVLEVKDDGRARSLAAFCAMLQGDTEGARSHFVRAVALMPSHVGTWLGYGWLQLLTGSRHGAASAFEQALALDRGFGDTHGSLAVLAALDGETDRARHLAEVALRLQPSSPSATYALAILSGDAADPVKMRSLAASIIAS